MFIAKQNGLIVQLANTKEELEEKIKFCPNCVIEETDKEYKLFGGRILLPEEIEQKNKERVAMLKMTPRDFLLACTQKLGIKWDKLKELMNTNAQVAIELQFCNYVYRGNPLLDKLCGQFGVTPEQLDNLFKVANGESVASLEAVASNKADKTAESVNEGEEVK